MKRAITLLMIVLFSTFSGAQDKKYETLWKAVEDAEQQGLTKSALDLVQDINAVAMADGNSAQQIKTLLFKSKYVNILEEDALVKIVADFKEAIEGAKSPTKNILESMLATVYW